jgi:hypothetical protein
MRNIAVTPDLVARFFAKVAVSGPDNCWPYTGLLNRKGYGQIGIGQEMVTATHVALTIAGLPRSSPSHWALHRCDNPVCCNPRHLYWGTVQQNVKDMWERNAPPRKGLRGESNVSAKLTEDDVRAIRSSPEGTTAIARRYGVSSANITNIRKFKTWRHVS